MKWPWVRRSRFEKLRESFDLHEESRQIFKKALFEAEDKIEAMTYAEEKILPKFIKTSGSKYDGTYRICVDIPHVVITDVFEGGVNEKAIKQFSSMFARMTENRIRALFKKENQVWRPRPYQTARVHKALE